MSFLSEILSRLPIAGVTKVSSGAAHSDYLPLLDATGKIDSSMIPDSVISSVTVPASSVVFTPAGNIAAVNAQVAIQELDNETLKIANNLSDVVASTGFNNLRQAATTSYAGVVELATSGEVESGSDTATDGSVNGTTPKLVVTPSGAAATFLKKSGGTMTGNITLPTTQPASPGGDYYAVHKTYVDTAIAAGVAEAFGVTTGKVIWVSKGSNATDSRSSGDTYWSNKPYATLTAAKTAATSGDTIIVLPGVYAEKNLLKNGVNWYFVVGAAITYTTAVSGAIWDDSVTYGTNGPVTCKITGYGEFTNTSTSANAQVLSVNNASSNIIFSCSLARASSATEATLALIAGVTTVSVTDVVDAVNKNPITVTAGTHTVLANKLTGVTGLVLNGSGTLNLKFNTLVTSSYAIQYSSSPTGVYSIVGDSMQGGSTTLTSMLSLAAGASGSSYLKVRNILTLGTSIDNVLLFTSTGHLLKVANTEIKNTRVNSTATAIGLGNTSSYMTLNDVDMVVTSTSTYSMAPTGAYTPTVTLHGFSRSNKPINSAVTLSLGAFEQY